MQALSILATSTRLTYTTDTLVAYTLVDQYYGTITNSDLECAGPEIPITAVFDGDSWKYLTSSSFNQVLKTSAAQLPGLEYDAKDVSARSLRSGGAMSLLLAGADKDTVRLVGRWRSDALFTYLHANALPLIRHHAQDMLHHGEFTLMPGGLNPAAAEALLAQHPEANPDSLEE